MQIRFKDSDRAGKTSLVFNMGMPCPCSHLSKDLCTGAYAVHSPFLPVFFLLGKINRWNCKGPHMQNHTAVHVHWAGWKTQDPEGSCQRKRLCKDPVLEDDEKETVFNSPEATEHTNRKPVPLTQMLKLVMPLFCIKYEGICLILTIHSSQHWHSIW